MSITTYAQLAPAGDYIALRSKGRVVRGGKHQRGEVQGFSVRSRSRLMAKIAQLRKHHLPLFVTLTYPEQYPVEWEEFKADLHRFLVALRKKYPKTGVIWKLEFQKRGAAHFHLMLWGLDLATAQEYIPGLWHKIAGQGDLKHLQFHRGELRNEHCVQSVRSWRGVKSYASKYLAKLDERTSCVSNSVNPDLPVGEAPLTVSDVERLHNMSVEELNGKEESKGNSGRFWGVVGEVPFSPLVSLVIDIKTALEFRRAMAKKTGMVFRRLGFWASRMHPDWITFIEYYEREVEKSPVEGHPEFPPSWFLPQFYIENLECEVN